VAGANSCIATAPCDDVGDIQIEGPDGGSFSPTFHLSPFRTVSFVSSIVSGTRVRLGVSLVHI